jgi:3-isopropylmalate/(R)-2-methylmalate dehydratase large subunit
MNAPQTLAQKLAARASGRAQVQPGEIVNCAVDLAMFHDSSGPRRLAPMLAELNAPIWDKSRVVLVMDHYVPAQDDDARRIVRIARDWAAEQRLPHVYDSQGICHVVLAENGHVQPGMFCVGGDSHSPTGGAFGAFMFGIGSTEMLGVLVTGQIWLRVPHTLLMEWHGTLADGVTAKDMMLHMIGRFGMNGGQYQAVEFAGSAVTALSMQERMTLSNMSAELGAQVGLIAPDATTVQWLARTRRPVEVDITQWRTDPGAAFTRRTFDAAALAPQVPRRTARRWPHLWRGTWAPRCRWPTSAPAPAPSWTTCALPRACSRAGTWRAACASWWRPRASATRTRLRAKVCCRPCRTRAPNSTPRPAAPAPATAARCPRARP